MSVLDTDNVCKSFGGLAALDDVSVEIKPNKVNLLMGSNGCGKTTLINTVSGLLASDSGRIRFMEHDITKKTTDHIFNLGMIRTFQTPKLFANLSVLENLLVSNEHVGESFRFALAPGKWRGQERRLQQRARAVMEELNLSPLQDSLAYDLSGGQIKLLELGKVWMSDARLVLLDEPIAGINPKLAHFIFAKIADICRDKGITFLIIEHRLDIALQYADYVFVMNRGRIIAQDAPDRILQNRDVIESYL